MLEIGSAGGHRTYRRTVSQASAEGQKPDEDNAAPDLEAAVVDVPVRHAVAGEMERDAEERGSPARPHGRAQRRPGGGMHGDDHFSAAS
jgi:hypothetical protein